MKATSHELLRAADALHRDPANTSPERERQTILWAVELLRECAVIVEDRRRIESLTRQIDAQVKSLTGDDTMKQSLSIHVARFADVIHDADPDQSAVWQAAAVGGLPKLIKREKRRSMRIGALLGFTAGVLVMAGVFERMSQ